MKNLIIVLSSVLLAGAASAQLSSTPVMTSRYTSFEWVQQGAQSDHEAQLYTSKNDKYYDEFVIFNSDMEEIYSFIPETVTKDLTIKTYTKLKSLKAVLDRYDFDIIRGQGTVAVSVTYESADYPETVETLEEAKDRVFNYFHTENYRTEQDGDVYCFYSPNDYEYYIPGKYGTKYPTFFGQWNSVSHKFSFIRRDYDEFGTFTYDEAAAYVAERGDYESKKLDGKQLFVSKYNGDYYNFDLFGYQYPTRCYWLNEDGVLTDCYRIYYTTTAEHSDSWNLTGSNTITEEVELPSIDFLSAQFAGVDPQDFIISQTIFNDDDNYEYIVPVIDVYMDESISRNYMEGVGDYDVRTVAEKIRYTGFRIVNDKGTEVASAMFGVDNIVERILDFNYIDFGTKKYLTAEVWVKAEEWYSLNIIYALDSSTGALHQVGAPIRSKVSPRVANRSTPVNVTFGNTDGASRRVVVTSVYGAKVMSINVAAGQSTASIDTSSFAPGMYIVSVVEDGVRSENCKIIIR